MKKKNVDVMNEIAKANEPVTAGIDEKSIRQWVSIYVMGKEHLVPADLTVMQAMEFAGYRFIRSCGCRAGFCGACSTVYRKGGSYKLLTAMACQMCVEDGMYLVQIPFAPAKKAEYRVEAEPYSVSVILKHYPEIARCLSCNTCTKACPQGLEVMEYIQAALRGDFEKVVRLSFECIQCGLCAVRCPAEIVHYHIAQLARRMYGKYGLPEERNAAKRIEEMRGGKFFDDFSKITKSSAQELKTVYTDQQKKREVY